MAAILTTWKPQLRNITFTERPEWIEEWIYTEALAAKRFYNASWEFWVWEEAQRNNCSQAVSEDACIRGIQTAINRIKFIYGDRVGKWYEEFLDMKDIFTKVKHFDREKKLGELDGRK